MNEKQLLFNFKEVEMKDVKFSKWLRDREWTGEYNSIGNFNQFIINDEIIALVKYRNEYPVNRWIYIRKEEN